RGPVSTSTSTSTRTMSNGTRETLNNNNNNSNNNNTETSSSTRVRTQQRPSGAVCADWKWNRLCDARHHRSFNYMRRREQDLLHRIVPRVEQAEITDDMWPVLVDWLMDVAEEFELKPETVMGAISYLQQCL